MGSWLGTAPRSGASFATNSRVNVSPLLFADAGEGEGEGAGEEGAGAGAGVEDWAVEDGAGAGAGLAFP
jgi:hypothetical protein